MSFLFILDISLKAVFFGSIAGLLFFVLKKANLVKSLQAQKNIQRNSDILKLPQRIKDIGQGISREVPKMAVGLARRNKDKMAKKISDFKAFSQKRIIYKFKRIAPKFSFRKHNTQEMEIKGKEVADKAKKFDSSYWDNIQNQ